MSDQVPLFVEDYYDAIRATVEGLGGFKRTGHALKPDLSPDAAGRWLADCCNADKREKLSPTELGFLRRRARQAGVHVLAAFEMRDAGYADPVAIEPEDERAALMREFVEATKGMHVLAARIEKLGAMGDGHD